MISDFLRGTLACTLLWGVCTMGVAQSETDPCRVPEDKQLYKQLNELTDTATASMRKAKLIRDILEERPGFIPAIFERAILRYNYFLRGETAPQKVLNDLDIVEQACADKFPLLPYYRGQVYFYLGKYGQASPLLKRFIDHPEKLSDTSIPKLQEAGRNYDLAQFYIELEKPLDLQIERVPVVNTEYNEYLPFITPDNSQLLFTRKRKEKRLGDIRLTEIEELMVSRVSGKAEAFSTPEKMPYPFNDGVGNYGGVTMSVTNKELFLTRCMVINEMGERSCDIFFTRKKYVARTDAGFHYAWTDLEELPETVNGKDSWESQPSLSSDGQRLYYARYSEGDTRGIDIYVAERSSDGGWLPGKPIPGKVNTPYNDKAPFIHPDGVTLYFSSDGHPGAGGYDLYMSRLQKNGTWSQPVNLGKPVNTEKDEHGMIVSTDGAYGYYASNEFGENGGYDIVYFPMPGMGKPEEVAILKGFVDNAGPDVTLELQKANGKTLDEIQIESSDGYYATVLKKQDMEEPLLLNMKKKGYAYQSKLVSDSMMQPGTIEMETVALQPIDTGVAYRLNDIYFATNSAEIGQQSRVVIEQFAEFLQENPGYRVEIRGHTDNVGNPEDNLVLSQRRALQVLEMLKSAGVDPIRLSARGFGENKPLADNHTAAGRSRNRRTEFVLHRLTPAE